MRKDRKNTIDVQIGSVSRYHNGISDERYAFEGFSGGNKYFTSDRFIKLDEHYNRVDGKPLQGYGLEIELESTGITTQCVLAEVLNKIIFSHFPAGLFKLQNDISLGGSSNAEAITQVMTREFVRNNYAAFKAMYNEYFPAFRISCSVSGNCGMHVNISNALFGKTPETQHEAIRKLYYIVNHHYRFCCALFNRDPRHTHYCAQMRGDMEFCKTMDLSRQCSNHGICFNLGHVNAGRIELRLVGGQSNFACFRNTMESVFFLVDRVKRLSWAQLDDLTAIFTGCNQYVFDRLKSKCYDAGTITAEQIAAIRQTVKREELL